MILNAGRPVRAPQVAAKIFIFLKQPRANAISCASPSCRSLRYEESQIRHAGGLNLVRDTGARKAAAGVQYHRLSKCDRPTL